MNIFVYEFITGGGTWTTAGQIEPAGSLLAEGAAMARAVVADLMAVPEVNVWSMLDARLVGQIQICGAASVVADAAEERDTFERLACEADATLLIAPEMGGALLERCRRVEGLGRRLISPDSRFVAIAADKQQTAERLSSRGMRVPPGVRLDAHSDATDPALFPAVLKPCDGAGSWLAFRMADRQALQCRLQLPEYERERKRGNLRLEQFVPGLAASVAVLCGPKGNVPLAPCEQLLADEGFGYQGGTLPLPAPLAARASKLAAAAVAALPRTSGHVGVDLILGAAADGSQDYVIELNPRLTTSYVGLRAACRQNLASAMLDVAAGRGVTLSFDSEPLEFRADGTVVRSLFTDANA